MNQTLKFIAIGLIAGIAVGGFISYAGAAASFNPTINYEGKLTDTNGVAVADSPTNPPTPDKCMEFTIYDAPTNGNILWGPEIWDGSSGINPSKISTTSGEFSVLLGTHVPFTNIFNGSSLYLQVAYEPGCTGGYTEVFLPRKQLGSVPSAFQSAYLEGGTWESPGAIGSTTASSGVFTTVNGMTITSSTGTLTIANGKTLTDNNNLTFSGTDGSTLNIGSGGTLGTAAYASPGTGLTLNAGSFSVNTSQNISTLSNLTSNGLIKTSGGTGALSIATPGTDYLASINASSPLSGSGTSGSPLIIAQADASTPGYLSSIDWNTFNGKQANLSLAKGTYTDGGVCTYTSSGTFLNCNTTLPSNYWSLSGSTLSPTTATEISLGNTGSNLIVDPNFNNIFDWTYGPGWSIGLGALKNTNGTSSLLPHPALTVIAGATYQISFTCTVTSGNFQIYIGNNFAPGVGTSGTYSYAVTTYDTSNLSINPIQSSSRFAITSISVQLVQSVTIQNGTVTANALVTQGGTSSQFVKGNGTLDSNTYLTSSTAPGAFYWNRTLVSGHGAYLSPQITTDRLLLGGATDDGTSALQVNGVANFNNNQYINADGSIGLGASAAYTNNVVFGVTASAQSPQDIAIGDGAVTAVESNGGGAIAIGNGTSTAGANDIAIGGGGISSIAASTGAGEASVAIGNAAYAANSGLAFGASTQAAGQNAMAFGYGANAQYIGDIVIGNAASTGYDANSSGSTAIGANSYADSGGISLGSYAYTTGGDSVAIGNGSSATGSYGFATSGGVAQADADIAIGVGTGSSTPTVQGQDIALGAGANYNNVGNSLAQGFQTAIGQGVSNSTDYSMALGGWNPAGRGSGETWLAMMTGSAVFTYPIADNLGSYKKSIDSNNRRLYQANGTTIAADWRNGWETPGSDLAENYPTKDTTLSPGEITALDVTNSQFVTRADSVNSSDILGVVSTAPAMKMGANSKYANETQVSIALAGRVPVKVDLENGPINIGDRIALSTTTPGVGMEASAGQNTIGIALESFDGTKSTTITPTATACNVDSDCTSGQTCINNFCSTTATTTNANPTATTQGTILVFVQNQLGSLNINGIIGDGSVSGVNSSSVGASIINSILNIGKIVIGTATINTANIQTANIQTMQMTDSATGDKYCIWIENGDWQKVKGNCSDVAPASLTTAPAAPASVPAPSETPSPTPTSTSTQPPAGILNISSVAPISDINVAYGTALASANLPATVTATMSDSTTQSVAVVWDSGTPAYDPNTAGTYVFSGTLSFSGNLTNTNNLKAAVNVIVAVQPVPTQNSSADLTQTTSPSDSDVLQNAGANLLNGAWDFLEFIFKTLLTYLKLNVKV